MRILIVDDDATNRFVLQTMLAKAGHEVISAEDGVEAIEVYEREQPDAILMDVMMPRMDGMEATRRIKAMITDRYVPVIFLTALSDDQALAQCVDAGGDDFLTKPYKKDLLNAKLISHSRMRELYNTSKHQRDELEYHNERIRGEQLVAHNIYQNMVHAGCLDMPNIRYLLSSMSLFNGDVILGARTPSGFLHVMLGDFTGHGLSAAIGAVPLSNIFYTMTAKGFSIPDMVEEMNRKLKELLPLGMFCAACVFELDLEEGTLQVWNGGIPGVYITDEANTEILHTIESQNAPLGIRPPKTFKSATQKFELKDGDRIYLCTDGITEARNEAGEMFGDDGFRDAIHSGFADGTSGYDAVMRVLETFRGDLEQDDDMTFIEITVDSSLVKAEEEAAMEAPAIVSQNAVVNEWDMVLTLDISTIRSLDPIPLLNQFVVELSAQPERKQQIFMVLSELITNAIDHGILGLDSAMKETPDGFIKYYEARGDRLIELASGSVEINLRHHVRKNGGELLINIKDSGTGFDYNLVKTALEKNERPSGRGIGLIYHLCRSVVYKGKGNEVEAIYAWSD